MVVAGGVCLGSREEGCGLWRWVLSSRVGERCVGTRVLVWMCSAGGLRRPYASFGGRFLVMVGGRSMVVVCCWRLCARKAGGVLFGGGVLVKVATGCVGCRCVLDGKGGVWTDVVGGPAPGWVVPPSDLCGGKRLRGFRVYASRRVRGVLVRDSEGVGVGCIMVVWEWSDGRVLVVPGLRVVPVCVGGDIVVGEFRVYVWVECGIVVLEWVDRLGATYPRWVVPAACAVDGVVVVVVVGWYVIGVVVVRVGYEEVRLVGRGACCLDSGGAGVDCWWWWVARVWRIAWGPLLVVAVVVVLFTKERRRDGNLASARPSYFWLGRAPLFSVCTLMLGVCSAELPLAKASGLGQRGYLARVAHALGRVCA